MKFMHLADLHIGKRVNGYSLIEDQEFVLEQTLEIMKLERVNALLIAGDVYDKSIPAGEAVSLFDKFIVKVFREKIPVFIISGNHDSAERLAFASRIIDECDIHFAPVYQKEIKPWTLKDAFGEVDFWLIPFIRPTDVRRFWPDEKIDSYTDAMRVVMEHLELTKGRRNVALVHQFITNSERCDSEEQVIGGLDNVDCDVFDKMDYVALGHLHGPQSVGRETIRYAGSPLKYSFSEINHQKSVTIVELEDEIRVRTIPLAAKRDWVELRGSFDEIISNKVENPHSKEDYYRIILTDEVRIPDVAERLRACYPNWMCIEYAFQKEVIMANVSRPVVEMSPEQYFAELFRRQMGREMNEGEKNVIDALMADVWGCKN